MRKKIAAFLVVVLLPIALVGCPKNKQSYNSVEATFPPGHDLNDGRAKGQKVISGGDGYRAREGVSPDTSGSTIYKF